MLKMMVFGKKNTNFLDFQDFFLNSIETIQIDNQSKFQVDLTIFTGFMVILVKILVIFPLYIKYRENKQFSYTDPCVGSNKLKTVEDSLQYMVYRWKEEKKPYKAMIKAKPNPKYAFIPPPYFPKFQRSKVLIGNKLKSLIVLYDRVYQKKM